MFKRWNLAVNEDRKQRPSQTIKLSQFNLNPCESEYSYIQLSNPSDSSNLRYQRLYVQQKQEGDIQMKRQPSQSQGRQEQLPQLQVYQQKQGQNIDSGQVSQKLNKRATIKPRTKQKGLRKLTELAYKIVETKQCTTYKDVASKLVSEFKQQNSRQIDMPQQENNIKRRVYDSLNVLIALNILQKKQRKIFFPMNLKKAKQNFEKKKENVQKKKQQLLKRKRHISAAQFLLRKNKQRQINENSNNDDKIKVPFISLIPNTKQDIKPQEMFRFSKNQRRLRTKLKTNRYQIMGDMVLVQKYLELKQKNLVKKQQNE